MTHLCAFPHQLPLDGEDSISGCLTVALPARDDNHLRVTVLCRQVDLSVGLLADLGHGSLTTSFKSQITFVPQTVS